jgi:hypothetical protein
MAPPRWTTTSQHAYLDLQMPDYIRRQAEKKLHRFWPAMEEGWFSLFPEHAALGLPLPSDTTAAALTKDENAALGIAIEKRKGVRYSVHQA